MQTFCFRKYSCISPIAIQYTTALAIWTHNILSLLFCKKTKKKCTKATILGESNTGRDEIITRVSVYRVGKKNAKMYKLEGLGD